MIPTYLQEIATIEKERKNCFTFSIKCKCGCKDFFIYQNKKTKEDDKKEKLIEKQIKKEFGKRFYSESDSNGNVFLVRKNIFGIVIKKKAIKDIDYLNYNIFKNFVVVKCKECNNTYLIFDENQHGYDACCEERNNKKNIDFNNITDYSSECQQIQISVFYNKNAIDDNAFKDKTIAFDRIKIDKIRNNKKQTLLDLECA